MESIFNVVLVMYNRLTSTNCVSGLLIIYVLVVACNKISRSESCDIFCLMAVHRSVFQVWHTVGELGIILGEVALCGESHLEP